MIKKILILIVVSYFLTILQSSFLVHFIVWGKVPNLVLSLVIFLNILESRKKNFGFYSALIGGFFLDIFSNKFIGFNILILLAAVIFIKFVFKRYVRIPFI